MLWSQPQRFFPVWGLRLSGFQSTRAPASSTAFSCTKWLWSRSAFTQSEPENKRVGGNTLRGGLALAQSKSNWETRWVGLAPLLLSLLEEIQRPALPLLSRILLPRGHAQALGEIASDSVVFRCASVWRSSSFQVLVNQLLMPKPSCRAFNLPPPREVLPPPILNFPGSTVGAGPALLPKLEETLGFFGKTLSS